MCSVPVLSGAGLGDNSIIGVDSGTVADGFAVVADGVAGAALFTRRVAATGGGGARPFCCRMDAFEYRSSSSSSYSSSSGQVSSAYELTVRACSDEIVPVANDFTSAALSSEEENEDWRKLFAW